MSSFNIWPSEAVLIGMFLEEYLQAREDYEKTSVLDFIDSRLRSFVPEMTVYSTVPIDKDDVPPDVEWKWESQVAVSLSTRRVFVKSGGTIGEHIITDSTRKSLADLVRDIVYPYAAKSSFDEAISLPPQFQHLTDITEWSLREIENTIHQVKQVLVPQATDPEQLHELEQNIEVIAEWGQTMTQWVERREVDDEQAVEREIVTLIKANDLTSLFRIGRILGRVLSDCHRCDWGWVGWGQFPGVDVLTRSEIGWLDIEPEYFFECYEKNLRELRGQAQIESLPYAQLVIDRELARCVSDRIRFGDATLRGGLSRTAQIRTLVGMIAGELIASQRDADTEAGARDAESGTPRVVRMPSDLRRDPSMGPVSVVWDDFSKLTSTGLPAEGMLRMVVNTVETEVRSVWPEDFRQQGRRADFGKILDDKARSTSHIEQRFARHAQHLYKQYRVDVVHPRPDLSLSCLDVLYFLYGIRVLHELAERIKKGQDDSGA